MKKHIILLCFVFCFFMLPACGVHLDSTLTESAISTARSESLENNSSVSTAARMETPTTQTSTLTPSPSPSPSPTPKPDWVTVFVAFENYHEGELDGVRDALEAAGYKMVMTSTQTGKALSMGGESLQIDTAIGEIDDVGLGIIIVGGTGVVDIWNNEVLLELVRKTDEQGLLVAGICAGPGVLGNAGVLEGKTACWYDGPNTNSVMSSAGCENSGKSVTVDGYAVTGNGPSAASDFGDAIVSVLNSM